MGRSPFDFQSGVTQWRMAPVNGLPLTGDDVFTLGYDGPVPFVSDIAIGDYFETSQTISLTDVAVVRCRVNIQQPDTMPTYEDVSKDFQLIGETGGDPGNKIVLARGVTEADINRTITVTGCTNGANNTSLKIVGIKNSLTAYVNKTVVTEGPRASISAIMLGARWKFSLLVEDGAAPIERAKVIQSARESGFYRSDMSMHVSKMSGTHTVYFRITLVDLDATGAEPALRPTPGMRFWFDATVGVSTIGTDITAWADQSGNHYDVAALGGGARFMQYTSNSVNGLPGVTGTQTGIAQSLIYTASNLYIGGDPRTVFAVVKPSGYDTTFTASGIFAFRRNAPMLGLCLSTRPDVEVLYTNLSTFISAVPVTTYVNTPIIIRWEISATTIQTYINNVLITQDSNTLGSEGGAMGFIVGALLNDSGSYTFQGDINELLGYDGVLSGPNIATVQNYLSAKWAIA